MRTKNFLLKTLFLISVAISCSTFEIKKPETNHFVYIHEYQTISEDSTSSLKLYKSIEKYSEEYNVPRHILYNIAFIETRYQGPFHWDYKHNLGSYAGALGPMQIMPSTAKLIHKKTIPKVKLKNDIDFNVSTSAILLNKLFNTYKDWRKVCGAYNTGQPIINSYAKYCTENVKYWEKWLFFSCKD